MFDRLEKSRFLAIDFETANTRADSACSIGMVKVDQGQVISKEIYLIRPPTPEFMFTWLHGISWQHVKGEPTFGELWPKISAAFDDVDFVAAHNAGFDQRVLAHCCARYDIPQPQVPFLCTVQLARETWKIYPTKLPNVCDQLGIDLNHHEALSDALACAQIVIAAGNNA
jgi:DNA polymerase-3 subunit epsilon